MSTWVVAMVQQQSGGRYDDRVWPPPGVEFEVPDWEGAGLVHSHTAVKIRELEADRPAHVTPPAPVSLPAETAAGPVPPAPAPEADASSGLVAPGFVSGGGEGLEDAKPADPEPPKPGDQKQDWYNYAVSQGYTGQMDDITKADLMSRYGGRL